MESIYTELALYGSKNECARTDNVFSPISEVRDGTVSLSVRGLGKGYWYIVVVVLVHDVKVVIG